MEGRSGGLSGDARWAGQLSFKFCRDLPGRGRGVLCARGGHAGLDVALAGSNAAIPADGMIDGDAAGGSAERDARLTSAVGWLMKDQSRA